MMLWNQYIFIFIYFIFIFFIKFNILNMVKKEFWIWAIFTQCIFADWIYLKLKLKNLTWLWWALLGIKINFKIDLSAHHNIKETQSIRAMLFKLYIKLFSVTLLKFWADLKLTKFTADFSCSHLLVLILTLPIFSFFSKKWASFLLIFL